MRALKFLYILVVLLFSSVYSMQQEINVKKESKLYKDKYKNKIDFNIFNKLPKILLVKIFSYISQDLQSIFEYTLVRYIGHYLDELGVEVIAISSNDKYIVTNSICTTRSSTLGTKYDCHISLWNTQTTFCERVFPYNTYVLSAKISQDEKYVFIKSSNKTTIYSIQTGRHINPTSCNFEEFNESCNDSSSKYKFFKKHNNSEVEIYDNQTGILKHTFQHGNMISKIRISRNDKYLVICSSNKVTIWNIETCSLIYTINCSTNEYYGYIDESIDISPNDKYVVMRFCNTIKIFVLPKEQSRIISSLKVDQLALAADLCKLKIISKKNIVVLDIEKSKIFESLPKIIKLSLSENCDTVVHPIIHLYKLRESLKNSVKAFIQYNLDREIL